VLAKVAAINRNDEVSFAVVVPAYNARATIEETLDSIISQSVTPNEIIVINDGSTDDTGEIIDAYTGKHENLRVIHQENGGSGAAINTGLYDAASDYICICSSDDILMPNCLSVQQETLLRKQGFTLFCTAGYHFSLEEGWERPFFNSGAWKNSHEIDLSRLLKTRFFGSGITFSRVAALAVGGYAAAVYAEDFDFYLRMLLSGNRMWYSNAPCVKQRVSSTQKSANTALIKESVLGSIQSALAQENVSPKERTQLIEGLALSRAQLDINESMLAQKAVLDSMLSKVSNERIRKRLLSTLRWANPLVRPLRRFLASTSHRRFNEDSNGR